MLTTTQVQPVNDTKGPIARESLALNAPQKALIAGGVIVGFLLLVYLLATQHVSQSMLLGIGLLLGYTLFHARFGFTSAFRRMASVGNGQAMRSHMLMLAVAVSLFAPILAYGTTFFGGPVAGYVSPVGVSLLVGAFMFGIGMQLGGGCASGTLYAIGGGRTVMFVTLIFFIVGATIGAYHLPFWTEEMPAFAPYSLATSTGFGYGGAWLVSIILFGLIAWITLIIEKKRKAPKMAPVPSAKGWKRILRGSWPLFAAAIALALLNALTLMTRGAPWGITSAFALWGSKIAGAFGVDVASWGYWQGANAASLEASIFADSTTVLNFGVILGAFIASAAGGLFKFTQVTAGNFAASVIGGLLMGYGARLAFGCNIGAYFGGIASFSLHGYIWGILALAGTFLALYLRPLFGLSVPKSNDSVC
ncbi:MULTISPECIES: YeeE/YedE family protein [Planococcaceae]|uniref:YeeE/YedE family protein n=1 Tax=Planococcus halotolerans TaxID=2233542 RepID=A0A365L6S8_9BACL|nr:MULTISPECIES: YeeE/YedE family protein [Planococcaceae]QHJ72371.1 YeeE/YedE family protein [Planococcus halotolerans]RAZ81083.1 YeeE/YedE family protein [Planococcus halotolerans]RLQ90269.1 YeeE/YedE family protein [Planomicrobium sp. Y74]